MGNITPGALFRLGHGVTGMVTKVDDGGCEAVTSVGTLEFTDYQSTTVIAPHIICEPGDGPIRGNDKALADAQARAVRMEAERDDVIKQWNEARAELHNLRGQIDAVTRGRDTLNRADVAPPAEPKDAINHPSHYTATEFEPVVVIESLNPHAHVAFAIKYLARAPHKGRLAEDLKKARWYLLRAVACGVVGRKHPNGRRIAASWCAHYPEKLRESAEDAIDYMLAGDYDRSQLLVLACLDAVGGAACTG